MSETPKRRLSDRRGSGPPTLIAPGVVLRGDLIAPGSVVCSGAVTGDGDIGATLSLAREARWEGNVRCGAAVIAGTLTGDIEVAGPLEIGTTGVVRGSVTAATIAIARGAVIEGVTRVTSGAEVLVFEEKRASRLEPET